MNVRITPERLANLFEEVGSSSVQLKSNADVLGVDSFQSQFSGGGDLVGSNVGVGPTRISGGVQWVDLSDYTQVKFRANVTVAGNTAQVQLYYSLDGTTLIVLTTNTAPLSATGVVETAWEDLPLGARTVCGFEGQTFGGDGSEDPAALIIVHFRR